MERRREEGGVTVNVAVVVAVTAVAWCGVIWHGAAWCGMEWRGVAWCGMWRACGGHVEGMWRRKIYLPHISRPTDA